MLAFALTPILTALLGQGPAAATHEGATDSDAPASSEPAPPATDDAQAESEASEESEPAPIATPEQVADVVLPCGLRVIAAKDASLPVAAVVLSIEVGTRDDPDKLPGLVHALAYHLQQGNRELGPGEAIATAHDVGGLAAMAVGPAQVRFESLVPISRLDAQLRVESLRLRAPNTGRELWLKSLSYARNDDAVKLVVPRAAAAAAWNDPGLGHDGRVVAQALGDMLDQALGAQLSRLFDYRNATLVVVGPDEPQALLARVEPLFADLGARPRKPPPSATPPSLSSGPRVVALDRQNGDSMVWAVPGEPEARAWAQVLCGTLNRQERGANEAPKARVRCTYSDDPRRPLLVVRAIGHDVDLGPEPLIAERLARIADAEAEPDLAALIEQQRARIEHDLQFELRAPLDLAGYLASASERRRTGTAPLALRPRDDVLGLPTLPEPNAAGNASAAASLAAAIPELLDTRAAVLLLAPDQPVPPPLHPPEPDSPAQPDTTLQSESDTSAKPDTPPQERP